MPNLDESHNGPAIQHSIRVLDTAIKQFTVIVTVTSPFSQFSDPIHDQFSVSHTVLTILMKIDCVFQGRNRAGFSRSLKAAFLSFPDFHLALCTLRLQRTNSSKTTFARSCPPFFIANSRSILQLQSLARAR